MLRPGSELRNIYAAGAPVRIGCVTKLLNPEAGAGSRGAREFGRELCDAPLGMLIASTNSPTPRRRGNAIAAAPFGKCDKYGCRMAIDLSQRPRQWPAESPNFTRLL
jgi:hypothetical protein